MACELKPFLILLLLCGSSVNARNTYQHPALALSSPEHTRPAYDQMKNHPLPQADVHKQYVPNNIFVIDFKASNPDSAIEGDERPPRPISDFVEILLKHQRSKIIESKDLERDSAKDLEGTILMNSTNSELQYARDKVINTATIPEKNRFVNYVQRVRLTNDSALANPTHPTESNRNRSTISSPYLLLPTRHSIASKNEENFDVSEAHKEENIALRSDAIRNFKSDDVIPWMRTSIQVAFTEGNEGEIQHRKLKTNAKILDGVKSSKSDKLKKLKIPENAKANSFVHTGRESERERETFSDSVAEKSFPYYSSEHAMDLKPNENRFYKSLNERHMETNVTSNSLKKFDTHKAKPVGHEEPTILPHTVESSEKNKLSRLNLTSLETEAKETDRTRTLSLLSAFGGSTQMQNFELKIDVGHFFDKRSAIRETASESASKTLSMNKTENGEIPNASESEIRSRNEARSMGDSVKSARNSNRDLDTEQFGRRQEDAEDITRRHMINWLNKSSGNSSGSERLIEIPKAHLRTMKLHANKPAYSSASKLKHTISRVSKGNFKISDGESKTNEKSPSESNAVLDKQFGCCTVSNRNWKTKAIVQDRGSKPLVIQNPRLLKIQNSDSSRHNLTDVIQRSIDATNKKEQRYIRRVKRTTRNYYYGETNPNEYRYDNLPFDSSQFNSNRRVVSPGSERFSAFRHQSLPKTNFINPRFTNGPEVSQREREDAIVLPVYFEFVGRKNDTRTYNAGRSAASNVTFDTKDMPLRMMVIHVNSIGNAYDQSQINHVNRKLHNEGSPQILRNSNTLPLRPNLERESDFSKETPEYSGNRALESPVTNPVYYQVSNPIRPTGRQESRNINLSLANQYSGNIAALSRSNKNKDGSTNNNINNINPRYPNEAVLNGKIFATVDRNGLLRAIYANYGAGGNDQGTSFPSEVFPQDFRNFDLGQSQNANFAPYRGFGLNNEGSTNSFVSSTGLNRNAGDVGTSEFINLLRPTDPNYSPFRSGVDANSFQPIYPNFSHYSDGRVTNGNALISQRLNYPNPAVYNNKTNVSQNLMSKGKTNYSITSASNKDKPSFNFSEKFGARNQAAPLYYQDRSTAEFSSLPFQNQQPDLNGKNSNIINSAILSQNHRNERSEQTKNSEFGNYPSSTRSRPNRGLKKFFSGGFPTFGNVQAYPSNPWFEPWYPPFFPMQKPTTTTTTTTTPMPTTATTTTTTTPEPTTSTTTTTTPKPMAMMTDKIVNLPWYPWETSYPKYWPDAWNPWQEPEAWPMMSTDTMGMMSSDTMGMMGMGSGD